MSVPTDLDVLLSIRTRQQIDTFELEHADQATLDYLGEPEPDRHVYRMRFARLGENRVTLRYGEDQRHYLEFFVTEPVETVIKKRAAFIAANQQIRDPEKWYDGSFSLGDMQAQVLRSPDNTGGLHPYMVGGSDDPTLGKAALIAVKNVSMPEASESEASSITCNTLCGASSSAPTPSRRIPKAFMARIIGTLTAIAPSATIRVAWGRSTCGAPSTTLT